MIVVEELQNERTRTYSDAGVKIKQVDTGIIYDDAVDCIHHNYEETDIPIAEEEATIEDYQSSLARLGVDMNE